ncbi:MAG: hypothetical protein J6Y02_23675 [Pseudobutyrivibrio sp.]|nr:hypothetical protein [Pseudobutyrivibrio sp.]
MTEIIIAVIALVGTIVSGLISAATANKVTSVKIEALTKEVEKHNKVVERTFKLEQRVEDMDGRLTRVESS